MDGLKIIPRYEDEARTPFPRARRESWGLKSLPPDWKFILEVLLVLIILFCSIYTFQALARGW